MIDSSSTRIVIHPSRDADPERAGHSLVVLGDGQLATHPLPQAGSVTIGRSAKCDIAIFDKSISRRHALLHLGDPMAIEDLDSVNGTRVAGELIAPNVTIRIRQGEVIELGDVSILVQRRTIAMTPRGPDQLPAHARPGAAITASGFIVEDRSMIQLRRVIDRVAAGTLSVLLLGETGVGKEVLAELVHRRSPRKAMPFLRLNCAAVTESLLESELFGHEKGAFTGAVATKPGLLETANGGTVFLDEIGEISPALQVKLLRVLEERVAMRVGGIKGTPINVRFVAATNRDLEQEIAHGRFRQDLYYRLAGITLVIPPLRERVTEIVPLVQSFIANASIQSGRTPQISRDALALLEAYSWPGNIRELRNVVERAVLLCSDGVIRPEHLSVEKMQATYPALRAHAAQADVAEPATFAEPATLAGGEGTGDDRADPTVPVDLGDPALHARGLDALYPGDAERDRIIGALELCRGNQTKAAAVLGMSRRTLIYRLERYRLPRPRKPGKRGA